MTTTFETCSGAASIHHRLRNRLHPQLVDALPGRVVFPEILMFRSMSMIVLLLASLPLAAATLPNRPVASLDMQRYAGQWHEIARLPMFFERQCLDAVTATYTPQANGSIHVRNSCRTSDGRKTINGVAKIEPGQPGALRVRFAPAWLGWLPLTWAHYWVIDVDPNYQWAMVGSPDAHHLWILARRPDMTRQLFDQLKVRAQQRGYPVQNLVIMAPLD